MLAASDVLLSLRAAALWKWWVKSWVNARSSHFRQQNYSVESISHWTRRKMITDLLIIVTTCTVRRGWGGSWRLCNVTHVTSARRHNGQPKWHRQLAVYDKTSKPRNISQLNFTWFSALNWHFDNRYNFYVSEFWYVETHLVDYTTGCREGEWTSYLMGV